MKELQLNKEEVEHFLEREGLNFKPLRAELLDHLLSDLEIRIQSGESFQHAWEEVRSEIPSNHFKLIQQQTMETINSRFRISRIFSNLFLALIILSSFFKFMHWPGAGILLISSFASLVFALLSGSLSGVYVNKTKNGSIWVLSVISGIILLLLAFSFRIFQFPGVEMLAVVAVIILSLSSILITLRIKRSSSDGETLLTFLHEKYTFSIQRALLVLLGVGVLFKGIATAKGTDYFVGDITLIMLIYGAGIHLLIFFWRAIEHQNHTSFIRFLVILGSISLFLPILNFYIPFIPRMILAATFYLSAGYLVYLYSSEATNKAVVILFLMLNFVHFGLWSMIEMGLLQDTMMTIIYSLPIVLLFLIPLWFFRKDSTTLAYWIICVAAFTLQLKGI